MSLPTGEVTGKASATTTDSTEVIAAPGAKKHLVIRTLILGTAAASGTLVDVYEGDTLRLEGLPCPGSSVGAAGGVFQLNLRLADNQPLKVKAKSAITTLYANAIGCVDGIAN